MRWILISTVALLQGLSLALAGDFPTVGITYQLDSAKYPSKVAICATEDAMVKYMEAQWANDKSTISKMLLRVSTFDDIQKLKNTSGCLLISSSSQAKIIKKGVEAHQAEFFAFPMEPMWGYYEYFGSSIR